MIVNPCRELKSKSVQAGTKYFKNIFIEQKAWDNFFWKMLVLLLPGYKSD